VIYSELINVLKDDLALVFPCKNAKKLSQPPDFNELTLLAPLSFSFQEVQK
jgi:hypothetical protein